MFLATTALSEFWDKTQEILFLGNWCLWGCQRAEWEGLQYKILPSPWDERERFYEAAQYVDQLYERLLRDLVAYLNTVHSVSYSHRYWRILLGPWLLHFVNQVYDRYIHLVEAFKFDPHLQTYVLEPPLFLGIRDAADMAALFAEDEGDVYNLQIISQILAGLGKSFPTHTIQVGNGKCKAGGVPNRKWYKPKEIARWALHRVFERIGPVLVDLRVEGVVFCHMMGHPPLSLRSLSCLWRKGVKVIPFKMHTDVLPIEGGPVFDQKRQELSTLPSRGEFERIFMQFLPNNFPTLYLEEFQEARARVLDRYGDFPSVICSSVGWYYDEEFKFFAAEAAERKRTRLLAVQHGGGYGQLRCFPYERHEIKLSDRFMAWGWGEEDNRIVRNLPNPMLSERCGSRFRKCPQPETILFVSETNPRYVYRLQTTQLATQLEAYTEWKCRFLAAVSQRLRSQITFRLHPAVSYYSSTLQIRIGCEWPEVQWDYWTPFSQLLGQTRIAIIDYCGGPLLEALAANVATVLFWDPKRWEMREEAQPYFEDLRKVGILWDSPESAAVKLTEIYDNVEAWWGSAAVQESRRGFAERYALTRTDWAKSWSQALKKELSLAEGTAQETAPLYDRRSRV